MMRTLTTVPAALGKQYIDAVLNAMTEPGGFFESEAGRGRLRPIGVLVGSALIYTGAALLLYSAGRPLITASVLFVNAAVNPLIAAVIGYALMWAALGKRVAFSRFFGVYAYASAVVLLVAWMPYALLVAEPWRWWLVGKGLMRGCGLSLAAVLGIVGVTIPILVALFGFLTQATA